MATEAPPVSPPPSDAAAPPKPEQAAAPETPTPETALPDESSSTHPESASSTATAVVTTRETESLEAGCDGETAAAAAAEEENPEVASVAATTLKEDEGEKIEQPAAAAAQAKEEEENPSTSIVESKAAENDDNGSPKTTTNTDDDHDQKKKRVTIQPAVSFKEESYLLTDLSESELTSLNELKHLLQESIANNTLLPDQPPSTDPDKPTTSTIESTQTPQPTTTPPTIWGIPLLADDRTDVILLKFLRARDFNPAHSLAMLKRTLAWRLKFSIDSLLDEDLGSDLDKVVFMHGQDRDGHPVCYNVYGEFQNKDLYAKTFGDDDKRRRFLRWRVQFLEKSIRKLDFRPGGVNTIFQVNDLKNAPGPGKKELRQATRQGLGILQDNYPEFVAKQVFINLPWWYVAFYTMMSPFMTQRTKSKFVFVGPAKTAETLFKYISPEQVPIQYGGLSVDFCECDPEFTIDDPATELIVKPTTKQFVEILVSEKCVIVWELRVVGWDVSYSAEFIPSTKDKYTVMIQKSTKMSSSDDPVVSGSFKISDLGKIVLTVDNPTFRKRRLVYRYKVLPYPEID